MKIRTKILLSLLLISTLAILLVGCLLPDSSPGYTPGSITGRIMIPSQCADCLTDGPCLPKGNGDIPTHWVPAEEAIVTVIPHAALTDEDGYYTLTNVEPGVYYVITATIGGNLVLKDVVMPDGVEAGKTYDAETANCYSTALGLVVEYFIDSGLTTEEIGDALEMYVQDSKFDQLVETVCCIIEDCDDITNYCCLVECDPPGFTCSTTSLSLSIPTPACDTTCTTINKPITVKFVGKDDVVINDFSDPRLTWSIPSGIDFTESTGELCLTGSLGTYSIKATYDDPAPDLCGSVSRTVSVTFSECFCPPPTEVSAGGPYSDEVCPEEDSTIVFNGSASGTGLTYNWDFGDGESATNAGAIPNHTYKYPFTDSPYTVTLTVINECGTVEVTTEVDITVCVNTAPKVDPIPYQAISAEGALQCTPVPTYKFTVSDFLSDDEGNNLIYSFVGDTPTGMTIDADSGLIEWKPVCGDIGTDLKCHYCGTVCITVRVQDDGCCQCLYTDLIICIEIFNGPTDGEGGSFAGVGFDGCPIDIVPCT